MNPDPEDVAQEVALQRLLGRVVNPRIVRLRLRREDARRVAAERGYAEGRVTPAGDFDATRFPLLHAKHVLGLDGRELLRYADCKSRSTLAARLRAEADEYLGGTR